MFIHYNYAVWTTSLHYNDVIMSTMASQIISFTIVYWTVYSGADQRKHQSSASLPFVRGIHWWPVNYPRKWPVTRKMFPFDDVIMYFYNRMLLPSGLHRIVQSAAFPGIQTRRPSRTLSLQATQTGRANHLVGWSWLDVWAGRQCHYNLDGLVQERRNSIA